MGYENAGIKFFDDKLAVTNHCLITLTKEPYYIEVSEKEILVICDNDGSDWRRIFHL